MSKISDKAFILILIFFGVLYFYFKGSGSNDQVDLSKVSFVVDGETKFISDFQGKNMVVNFYASWCQPCMNELPAMARTADSWDKVTFLWLTDEGQKVIEKSKSKFHQDTFYPLSSSFKSIGIASIPYTVIFNKNGDVVFSKSGQLNWDNESFKSEIQNKLN